MDYVVLHRNTVHGYAAISILDMVRVYASRKSVEYDN